jgi:sulfotransferase
MAQGFLSQLKKADSSSQKYYFMGGLPRSGSSLLSAILNQNPNIFSGPSSPVLGFMVGMETIGASNELYKAYPNPEGFSNIQKSIIKNYYSGINKPIIIDKNREWSTQISGIELYINPQAKIICPVRDIAEILTSFIQLIRNNPYEEGNTKINFVDEALIKNNIPITDDNRCLILGSENGILGSTLISIKNALDSGLGDRIHFVEYKDLTSNPQETMNKIYQFLGEPQYQHDFSNLKNLHREDDLNTYGLKTMHEVRKELKYTSSNPSDVLSEEILNECKDKEFWRSN